MSTENSATYSMVLVQLIEERRKRKKLIKEEMWTFAGISRSTWTRLSRGQSSFTIDELRKISAFLGISMAVLIDEAEQAVQHLPDRDGVQIVDSKKASDDGSLAGAIIASAALGFLISRIVK